MATPNLGLITSPGGATDIATAYNPSMAILDVVAQLSVVDVETVPPVTTDDDRGKAWIIGDSASGVWSGKDGQLALVTAANVWLYLQPKDGWRAGSAGGVDYRYDAAGNDWIVQAPLTNPMLAPGDVIVGGASGVATRLAAGTEGEVLKITAGVPAWEPEGGAAPSKTVQLMLSDMATSLTTGTGKAMWVAPEAGTLDDFWLAVFGQSSSGVVRADLNKNGVSVMTTRPAIDAGESTSLTGTAAAFSSAAFVKGDIFTLDIDDAGTSAEGLQAILEYTPA